MVTVADMMPFHCKDQHLSKESKRRKLSPYIEDLCKYHEPLKNLTPFLMISLQRILEERKSASTPRVLPYLVSTNSQRLVADFSNEKVWTKKKKEDLIQRICDIGQNISDLTLHLGPGRPVNADLLKGMLGGLTNLTSLKLKGDEVDNSTLATIGSSCLQLRVLILSSCKVNDEGLRYLYDSELPLGEHGEKFGQCKKMTHLDVDIFHCEVTIDGMVALLSSLPDLVYLMCQHFYEVVAKFVETNTAQLKLQNLRLQFRCELNKNRNILASVISKVQDIRKLEILDSRLESVDEFLMLEHVTDLKIGCFHSSCQSKTLSLITKFSQNLTKLELIFWNQEIDISIIGFHCNQLTKLKWNANCTTESKYKLLPLIHFNKLKKVELNTIMKLDFTFSDDSMKCILASPCLEKFSLIWSDIYSVPDSTFSWLIEEARAHGEVFSNLRELDLNCEISSVRAKQILCVAPKLKIFKVHICASVEDLEDNVKEFMRQNNLNHFKLKSNF